MIYLKALTFILLFSKCFGSDNDDDYIRNIQDQPIHSPSYSHEWTTPQEDYYHNNYGEGFDNFHLWEHNLQIPYQQPPQQIQQQMHNQDYHFRTSLHQQPIYHQPLHNPSTQFPTIPSQGESSSMPNLQNNPNEIEDEDQKYLLVTQEMINQREKEKGKYNVLKYQQVEEKNMSDMDSGLDINKIIDKGFSLNSEKITGDHVFFVKTRIYKCFKYTSDQSRKNTFNLRCKERTKNCSGRITYMTFDWADKQNLTNNITETQPHTCKSNGSFEHNKNICVKPGVTNIKKLSYCIYIEYNINGHSERITNFVGTQEMGHDCKEQKFKTEENIKNIQFIVVWSENIFFGKDDVLYESRFNVGKKELMTNDQIKLNINTSEKTTKLKYDPKTKELIPDI
uniref:Uncharacterized protein n=1 Tax=Meloidogyne floridensis TaxID=298350 RepID=A0A915P768_9BILA